MNIKKMWASFMGPKWNGNRIRLVVTIFIFIAVGAGTAMELLGIIPIKGVE